MEAVRGWYGYFSGIAQLRFTGPVMCYACTSHAHVHACTYVHAIYANGFILP